MNCIASRHQAVASRALAVAVAGWRGSKIEQTLTTKTPNQSLPITFRLTK
jgi:hypothetical protein